MTERNNPYLSVEEARTQFPNQRILMEVKEFGEYHEPLGGEVIYHSRRGSPWKRLTKIINGRSLEEFQQEGRHFYVFAGEEQPPPDPDKAFAQFIRFTNRLAKEVS